MNFFSFFFFTYWCRKWDHFKFSIAPAGKLRQQSAYDKLCSRSIYTDLCFLVLHLTTCSEKEVERANFTIVCLISRALFGSFLSLIGVQTDKILVCASFYVQLSGIQRDSILWLLRYRCSALSTELWRPYVGSRPIYRRVHLYQWQEWEVDWSWFELRQYRRNGDVIIAVVIAI